jgi:uncharacterized protein (TIGR03067 family)
VPTSLLAATLRVPPLLAAGQAASGAAVAALAKAVVKSMLLARLKVIPIMLLVLAALGGGATVLAYRTPATGLAEVQRADRPGAVPEPARNADRMESDRMRLQGFWVPVAGEVAGRSKGADDPKVRHLRLFFDGDTVALSGSDPVPYTLEPSAVPRAITIRAGGRQGTIKAIYAFDGGRLKLSWVNGEERPADFDTGQSQGVLLVLERRKTP